MSKRRATRLLLMPLAAIALVGLAAGLGLIGFAFHPQGTRGQGPVQMEVPAGAHGREIARLVEQHHLVAPSWMFAALLRLTGAHREVKAGKYELQPPLTPLELIRELRAGQSVTTAVTLPEGLTRLETAQLLAEKGVAEQTELLAAFADVSLIEDLDPLASDLEGYLFPETYRFPLPFVARRVAQELVRTFRLRFAEPYAAEIAASERSLREIVTLASLVEKETGLAEERGRIAGVFAERLRRGWLLQCDPTVVYALKMEGRWDGNIRKADLSFDHPYNTYRHAGLPPGPIASTGLSALVAAVEPDVSGALYFVAKGDGSHQFSRTLREHQRAVRRYQIGPARRR
ncbi:MAG: endolytic transglycosylase MltG [Acidobacteriota bacterium]|nr:MAG: endolytic transglycosylase MltG [Acidobacteriota bacterium]